MYTKENYIFPIFTGHYMYVEASGSRLGYKAILMSDIYSQSGPSCTMTFWYNMNGRNIGTLNIILKNGAGQNNVLASLTGNQGQGWKQLTVPLPSYNHFSVLFEAVQGNGYLGDIAIDDIQFNSCAPSKWYFTEGTPDCWCIYLSIVFFMKKK